MHRINYIFITIVLFSNLLYATEKSDEGYLQIVGENLVIKENIITAKGNVLVYSPEYYITADRLIYDRNTTTLELFNNVNILKKDKQIVFSEYAFLNMKDELNKFKPMLLLDSKEKLWFNSTDSKKIDDLYQLKKSTLSSCDCDDPDWSIGFTSGDYNTTKQWMNTYNTTLYVKSVPVFYTPYFGYPTAKVRKSGLLKPTIGWSNQEGLLYAQPIYIAPALNYDFEYIPHIRSQRGTGQALKYRYTDSQYSTVKIETGYFKEKVEFKDKMSLENEKHYGWNLEYKRSKLFSTGNSTDGMLIKARDMNDVDYLNTKYNNDLMGYTSKFLESKLSYFYNTDKYFSGLDLKLYNDISKENNDDVMQNIPILNFHKYSNSILFDKLTYSSDIKFSKKTRKVGLAGEMTDFNIPISYHSFLFNDYINLLLTEQIYFTNVKYKNNQNYEDVNYGRNNHIVSLYTDLLKPYENYLHTIKFNTTLTYANDFIQSGDIYGITNSNSDLSNFAITKSTKNISLGFNQSIYSKDTLKQIVNHKIKQSFIYNEVSGSYTKSDLENDLTYYYDYGSLSNRLLYNHTLNEIIQSSTTSKFTKNDYFFNLYHTFTKDKNTLISQRSISYDLGVKFKKYYTTKYREEYDLTQDVSKKKEYVFNINKKCWEMDFKLIDSLVATNTTDNSVLRQNILYIQINLKQLFELDQSYKFKQRKE